MIAAERQRLILRELELRGSVRVSVLARRFEVATMTIRRDLERLERAGRLVRTHGGALPPRPGSPRVGAPRSGEARLGTPRRSAPRAGSPDGRDGARGPITTVGMVVPSRHYYFPEIIRGAEQAAADRGARLVLAISGYSPQVENQQIRRLLDHGADALLVTPAYTYEQDPGTYRVLSGVPAPVVVVERSVEQADPGDAFGSVRSHHWHGAQVAVRALVERGHDRLLLAWRRSPTAEPVRAGVRRAMELLCPKGLLVEEEIPRAEADPARVHARMADVLDAARDRQVSALLILPDEAGIALLEAAQDRGIQVPQDLEIIAFDDEVSALAPVPLTAVSPPKFAVGHAALHACLDHLRDPGAAAARTTLLPTLTERESTRPRPG